MNVVWFPIVPKVAYNVQPQFSMCLRTQYRWFRIIITLSLYRKYIEKNLICLGSFQNNFCRLSVATSSLVTKNWLEFFSFPLVILGIWWFFFWGWMEGLEFVTVFGWLSSKWLGNHFICILYPSMLSMWKFLVFCVCCYCIMLWA